MFLRRTWLIHTLGFTAVKILDGLRYIYVIITSMRKYWEIQQGFVAYTYRYTCYSVWSIALDVD